MAVINDRGARRSRVSAARAGSSVDSPKRSTRGVTRVGQGGPRYQRARPTVNGTQVSAGPRAESAPPTPQRVTRLHPRPAAVEPVDQLPLAVGFGAIGFGAVAFGSTVDLPPCRLWAVPGSSADLVPLPAAFEDGSRDGEWLPSAARPVESESSADDSTLSRIAAGPDVRRNGLGRPNRVSLSEPAALRLTARGRAVSLLLAAAVGLVVVVFAWFGAGSSDVPARPTEPARITVHEGDTLWSIAGKVAPNHDPRAVVARLLALNHLRTPDLVPGQVLRTR